MPTDRGVRTGAEFEEFAIARTPQLYRSAWLLCGDRHQAEDLPPGDLGPPLLGDGYGVMDRTHKKIVHFRWNGTLTTFIVEPASEMGTCAELAAATPEAGCNVVGGLEVLNWPATTADLVTAQGAMVWQHGYIANAISYNASEGKDVAPVVDAPPISLEKLTDIASSEVWFE